MNASAVILRRDYVGLKWDDIQSASRETSIKLTVRIKKCHSENGTAIISKIVGKGLEPLRRRVMIFFCNDSTGQKLEGRLRRNDVCSFVEAR